MLYILYLFLLQTFFSVIKSQSIYRCSPIDGALDTYGFYVGSDNGMACVRGDNSGNLIMYMEKMRPSGDRSIAVATSQYDSGSGKYKGTFYRLYPPGPKRKFVSKTQPGFISLKFDDNERIEMVLKPNGMAWVPADIRVVTGCAQESPQLLLDVMDQQSRQSTKMMLCAMSANSGSGFNAVYGFGLRPASTIGLEPFIYLGRSKNAITPSGPLDIDAKLFDVCLRTDCRSCAAGYKALMLASN